MEKVWRRQVIPEVEGKQRRNNDKRENTAFVVVFSLLSLRFALKGHYSKVIMTIRQRKEVLQNKTGNRNHGQTGHGRNDDGVLNHPSDATGLAVV